MEVSGSTARCFSIRQDDSGGLAKLGDIWGLTAIVALVRQAEIAGDVLLHIELSKDMYRALPGILKLPWIAPSTELLQDCINQIRARVPLTEVMFDVDWSIIARHTADPKRTSSTRMMISRPGRLVPVNLGIARSSRHGCN